MSENASLFDGSRPPSGSRQTLEHLHALLADPLCPDLESARLMLYGWVHQGFRRTFHRQRAQAEAHDVQEGDLPGLAYEALARLLSARTGFRPFLRLSEEPGQPRLLVEDKDDGDLRRYMIGVGEKALRARLYRSARAAWRRVGLDPNLAAAPVAEPPSEDVDWDTPAVVPSGLESIVSEILAIVVSTCQGGSRKAAAKLMGIKHATLNKRVWRARVRLGCLPAADHALVRRAVFRALRPRPGGS